MNNQKNIREFLINDLKTAIKKYKNNYEEFNSKESTNMIFYGSVLNLPGNLSFKVIKNIISYMTTPDYSNEK
jgi:hypothetical protein